MQLVYRNDFFILSHHCLTEEHAILHAQWKYTYLYHKLHIIH